MGDLRLIPLAALILFGLASGPAAWAQDPKRARTKPVKPIAEELAKWVLELGHPRPAVKSQAATRLREAGPEGIITLLRGLDNPTLGNDAKATARELIDHLLWPTDEVTIRKSFANLQAHIDRRALDLVTETLLFSHDLADAGTARAVWQLAKDVAKECSVKSGLTLKAPDVRDLDWVRDDQPKELFGRRPFITSGVNRSGVDIARSVYGCTGVLGAESFKGDSIGSSTLFCRGALAVRGISNSLIVCDSVRPAPGFEYKQCIFRDSIVITRLESEITYMSDSCWVTGTIGTRKPQVSKGTIVEEDPSEPLFPMVRAADLGFDAIAVPFVHGAVVRKVRVGGLAERAGLKPWDRITAVNGRPAGGPGGFLALVRQVLVRGRTSCYLTVSGPKAVRYVPIEFPHLLAHINRR